MKAAILMINWVLSLCAISVNTETTPIMTVLGIVAWFCVSSLLIVRGGKKGVFDKIEKRLKMEDV